MSHKMNISYRISHPSLGNFQTISKTIEIADSATMKQVEAMVKTTAEQLRDEMVVTVAGRSFVESQE